MRITLDIDEDVLMVINEIARKQNTSAGHILTQLAREALSSKSTTLHKQPQLQSLFGFRAFRSRGDIVENTHIDAIRDAEGI